MAILDLSVVVIYLNRIIEPAGILVRIFIFVTLKKSVNGGVKL